MTVLPLAPTTAAPADGTWPPTRPSSDWPSNGVSRRFGSTPAEPTLSLGYFQATRTGSATRHGDGAWVRRHTGGAAILHHHEIPYALALPAGAPWHTAESWLCRFHHAVAAALKDFGVRTTAVVCGEEKKLGDFLCFLHQTPGDLLAAGHKVVGSAQRRPHGAMMQHGSILLRQSPHTPDLPGIAEAAAVAIDGDTLVRAVVHKLAAETGWAFEPADWTEEVRRRAAEVEREKYGTAAWNEKR